MPTHSIICNFRNHQAIETQVIHQLEQFRQQVQPLFHQPLTIHPRWRSIAVGPMCDQKFRSIELVEPWQWTHIWGFIPLPYRPVILAIRFAAMPPELWIMLTDPKLLQHTRALLQAIQTATKIDHAEINCQFSDPQLINPT